MAVSRKTALSFSALVLAGVLGYFAWEQFSAPALPEGIAAANGRIEATEVDIAALTGGRIAKISAAEGQFIKSGDVLVQMDITQLSAQKRQAEAQVRRARVAGETAKALVAQAEAQERAALAGVGQAQAAADATAQRYARTKQLVARNATSQQTLDDDEARDRQARAALAQAEASHAAALAGISSAEAQIIDAEAALDAATAVVEALQSSIDDATLTSPRDGRVQYLIAQEGEIAASGGRILSLVDLSDVYMTVFLPTAEAGRVQLGAQVRLVMDTAPEIALPATVSYVADVAQFTPKSVETTDEREKLMFRVRARIEPELLRKYLEYVKTGLPGMAYIQLDPAAEWPAPLANVAK